jgi:hypothetical protein
LFSQIEPHPAYELMRTLAGCEFEQSRKMRWAHAGHIGKIGHSEIFLDMLANECHDTGHPPAIDRFYRSAPQTKESGMLVHEGFPGHARQRENSNSLGVQTAIAM